MVPDENSNPDEKVKIDLPFEEAVGDLLKVDPAAPPVDEAPPREAEPDSTRDD